MSILPWIGRVFKYICCEMEYPIDSFLVKACHIISISRCRLIKDEKIRGYNAYKHEHFYGVKVQLVTTAEGIPLEMYILQDAEHDSQILKRMYHDFPPEKLQYGDCGYTNYEIEDMFREAEQVALKISRKSNSKRTDIPSVAFIIEPRTKKIETNIGQVSTMMPGWVNKRSNHRSFHTETHSVRYGLTGR